MKLKEKYRFLRLNFWYNKCTEKERSRSCFYLVMGGEISMRKRLVSTALICGILSVSMLNGCGKKAADTTAGTAAIQENSSAEETTTQAKESSAEETKAEEEGQENQENQDSAAIVPVTVDYSYDGDWKDQKTLFSSKVAQIKLMDDSHEKLQDALKALNQSALDDQKSVIDENKEYAEQEYASNPDMVEYTFDRDILVARSDETVLSMAVMEGSYLGGAHPFGMTTGRTYDTQTGKELSLKDVVSDYDGIYEYVKKQLEENYDQSMFFEDYQDTLQKMFYDESGDYGTVQWTISQTGLSIYFNQYDLAPYVAGSQQVDISFKEQPQLFQSKYVVEKESYSKVIRENSSCFADVNGDGKEEEISYSVARDEYGFGGAITVTCDGQTFDTAEVDKDASDAYGAYGAYSSEGYVLHTSDGRTYLYLQHLDDNDYRYVNVFRLDQGRPSYVGYEGMAWYNTQILDPDSFMLYTRLDVLGTYYGMKRYHVDEAGLPASDDEAYVINESSMLRSTRDLAVTILEKNGSETEATVLSGTGYTIFRTDGASYADAHLNDGRDCRIQIKEGSRGWGWDIDGVSEEECFEWLPYAG